MALRGKSVIKPDLSQASRVEHLKCIDTRSNHKKLYSLYLLPNGAIYAEACREGDTPTPYLYAPGEKSFDALLNEKLSTKKRYKRVSVVDAESVAIDWSKLGERGIEIQQELAQIQQEARGVADYTEITFDARRGVFMTQQGAIEISVVEQAQLALDQVRQAVNQSTPLHRVVEAYMTLIPVKADRQMTVAVLGSANKIYQQQEVLQTLTRCMSRLQDLGKTLRTAVRAQRRELFGADELSVFVLWGDPEKTNAKQSGDSHVNFDDFNAAVMW